MKQLGIDVFYLREAYKFAKTNSSDKGTQNGAILVTENNTASLDNIVARGANHFPLGVKETLERLERPAKYSFVEHAERSAIYDAARRGIKTEGLIMYCPWCACADCGRAIIQAGIKEVIGHADFGKFYHENSPGTNDSWKKSIETALIMFDEAGVRYRLVEEKIGGIEITIACKSFMP